MRGHGTQKQTVFVVDDHAGMRNALVDFFRGAGLAVEAFESAEGFIEDYAPTKPGCLILDIRMPGMSGVDLLEYLVSNGLEIPVIILSGKAVVSEAVKSMKLGSFDFIEIPYSSEFLLSRVKDALQLDQDRRSEKLRLDGMRKRFEKLSEREREILAEVVAGKQSKEIARHVHLSVSTVDNHRANVMKKLQVKTTGELIRTALLIESYPTVSREDPE